MSVPVKWHLIAFNGSSSVDECDRRTDGRTNRPRYAISDVA